MFIIGGRAGQITVLFGLIVFAIIMVCRLLEYAVVALICTLILIGRAIRWLWRRHKEHQDMHGPYENYEPFPGQPPKPVKSPVEHRGP